MNLFILFIIIISSLLYRNTNNLLYITPLIASSIILIYNKRYLYCVSLVVFYLIFALIPIKYLYVLEQRVNNYQVEIIKKSTSYYIVKADNEVYHYLGIDVDLEVGSIIMLNGKIERLKNETLPLVFNFALFIKTNNVTSRIKVENYKVIYEAETLRAKIIDNILYSLSNRSQNFIRLLLFGEKSDITKSLYDNLVNISAIQLFVVSGFHFNMLFIALFYCFKHLFSNKLLLRGTILSLLLVYLYLLNFNIASTRAYLFLVFLYLNDLLFAGKYSRISILSLIGIIMITFDLNIINSLSFTLSFIVCFTIEFISKLNIKKGKTLFKSIIIIASLIPIILGINYEYNLFALIANMLLSFPISIFYFFSIVVIIIPFLDCVFLPSIIGLEEFVKFISSLPLNIIFGKVENWFIVSYYLVFIYSILLYQLNLKRKVINAFLMLIFILVIQYCSPYIVYYETIHFIDVGQGDCILVRGAYNQYNFLVDTGGNRNYDLATNRLVPYFKALGIKYLDALFISHNDFDHNGAKDSLVKNFKVNKLIEGNDFQSININNKKIVNVNYDLGCSEDNECSSVLYFSVGMFNVLLTGDINKSIEQKIVDNYQYLDVDILKVAHHGSNTSTSKQFLDFVKPKFAIIQVGINKYGHPNQEVLETLTFQKIEVYNTLEHGSVIFKIYNNQYNISLYKP